MARIDWKRCYDDLQMHFPDIRDDIYDQLSSLYNQKIFQAASFTKEDGTSLGHVLR